MPFRCGWSQSKAWRAISSSLSRRHGSAEPHALGQAPEDLGVGQRLAERRDRRAAQAEVELAVRLVDVERLQGRRRRQHDVGVVDRVGREELVDDREQVLAREALAHLLLLRCDRRGVRVVDEERLDGRRERRLGEDAAELAHVERARAGRDEVRPLQRGLVDRERPRGGEQDAAPGVAPVPDHGGQAGDRAHRHRRRRRGGSARS